MIVMKMFLIVLGTVGFFTSLYHASRKKIPSVFAWAALGILCWVGAVSGILWWTVPGFFGGL